MHASENMASTYRCFGCQVIEGYGMTETSCVISSMDEGDNLTGHVGSPNPACGKSLKRFAYMLHYNAYHPIILPWILFILGRKIFWKRGTRKSVLTLTFTI